MKIPSLRRAETSAYSYLATEAAIKDSGLSMNDIQSENTGVVVGSSTGSSKEIQRVMDVFENVELRDWPIFSNENNEQHHICSNFYFFSN